MKQITLKAARANAGMSRKELAREIDACEKSIYNWEEGRTSIPKSYFLAICSVTGFEPEDIILPS